MNKPNLIIHKLLIICFAFIYVNFILSTECISFTQDKNVIKLEHKIRSYIKLSRGTIALAFVDLNNHSSIIINGHKPFVAASIIKVAIMPEVFRQVENGSLNLSQIIRVKQTDKLSGSGVLRNRIAGTKIDLKKLIYLMIARSDNTATKMLIDMVGMKNINNNIQSLGLKNTVLKEETLVLKNPILKANLTTAEDMLLLYKQLYFNQADNKNSCSLMLKILAVKSYSWGLPRFLPSKTLIAHKTGSLNGIRHDGGIIYTPKGNYVLCILTENMPSWDYAAKMISELSYLIYTYYIS